MNGEKTEEATTRVTDEAKIEEAVKMILEAIGEDPTREGLVGTPHRVAKMYAEVFSGMDLDAHEVLSTTFSGCGDTKTVLEKDISFYSMCEHHLMPFFGKVHIAYVPMGEAARVVGLSKLARTVEIFARRPQLQERMTNQIADALEKELDACGVFVMTEAEHTCMTMRGVKKPGSKTVTIAARGVCNDTDFINRALALIRG